MKRMLHLDDELPMSRLEIILSGMSLAGFMVCGGSCIIAGIKYDMWVLVPTGVLVIVGGWSAVRGVR